MFVGSLISACARTRLARPEVFRRDGGRAEAGGLSGSVLGDMGESLRVEILAEMVVVSLDFWKPPHPPHGVP